MKRASLHTLGCRLNFSETEVLRKLLEQDDYEIVDFGEPADLAIINTCTVTANADQKCRNVIRSFIRKNPHAFTAVIGCYSQMGYKALSEIEGVDLIVGNQEKLNVINYVKLGKNESPVIIRDKIVKDDFSIDFVDEDLLTKRANLKIQDGCNFICSFCIIPKARGQARSRDMDNLMAEAHSLVKAGAKELILTGVNIGTYNFNNQNILHVIENLNRIEGLKNIRISSIEPTTIPTELFAWMNDPQHALVPYLHIPLQSGCDKILKAMKRKYSLQEYLDFLHLAHESVKDLCLGTDIMVGFPGETDEDFETTCETFFENPFSYSHVFSYSRRDNTPAARAADQVPEAEKKRRSAKLRALSSRQRQAFFAARLGETLPVLFEQKKEGAWPGYTPNYIRVVVDSNENLLNTIQNVKLTKLAADYVEGIIVD